MLPRWRLFGDFLHAVFSASRAQHVSDLHSKFKLRPHHLSKYGRHPISDRWDYASKKKKKEEETTGRKYIWPALLHRAAIKKHWKYLPWNYTFYRRLLHYFGSIYFTMSSVWKFPYTSLPKNKDMLQKPDRLQMVNALQKCKWCT